ncbi:hypothetical protein AS026_02515 [Rhizobium altiplani]|uniref:Ferredoxin n=1 Tax=Rhizobium altiplani TaxID=1864509 RepID=A0A109JSF9_9HYPH|nr:PDR/VanB family oxidoreductase [Rhizobium altiplani]KWV54159.1 hypothetical protein AS026_02515 [Rhizobium altiplani]
MEFDVIVARINRETDRIRSYELRRTDGFPIPVYTPGSNITIALPNGMIRTYSLTDTGSEPDALRIAVLHQVTGRGGSQFIHHDVKTGDTLRVRGIANSFSLQDSARKHILVAGGIGITPILSMAKHLEQSGSSFEVHYAARSRGEAAFADILACDPFKDKVKFYFDDENQRIDLDGILSDFVSGTAVYCCGPPGLMNAVTSKSGHWPVGSVRLDSFEPLDGNTDDQPFTVKLASTGQIFDIPPGKSILRVLRDHGVCVGSQCEQGVCGACLTPIVEGLPDHRDRVLSESEKRANDLVALCCSRSLTNSLVLDM